MRHKKILTVEFLRLSHDNHEQHDGVRVCTRERNCDRLTHSLVHPDARRVSSMSYSYVPIWVGDDEDIFALPNGFG